MFDATFSVFNWMLMNTGLISKRILWLGDGTLPGLSHRSERLASMPFFAITLLAAQTVNPDCTRRGDRRGRLAEVLAVTLP